MKLDYIKPTLTIGRLEQDVHHTASELNGQDADPSLLVHTEVTAQASNKGITDLSTDASGPYQQPPARALSSRRLLSAISGDSSSSAWTNYSN